MNYRFTDLVDIEAFRSMLKSFHEATGILHGLVDEDNNILSAIGWQEACTDFHRANALTLERCLASNRYLAEHLGPEGYVGCQCKNGLMDYATAIVIEGRPVATLFFGQLLHEPPDLEFFRQQARECGLDEEAYLEAIRKVPVVPRDRIPSIMSFYVQMAQVLARSGLDRIRQREAEQRLADLNLELALRVEERTAELAGRNGQLSTEIAERRRTEESLRHSQAQLQAILDSSPVGIGWSDRHGRVEYINTKFTEMFGYALKDIPTVEHWYRLAYPDEQFRSEVIRDWARKAALARQTGTKVPALEAPVACKDGTVRHVLIAVTWVGDRRLVNFSDITARWMAEKRDYVRNSILEMIAKGADLPQILDVIVRDVEAEDGGMLCSILLLDRDGRHLKSVAAPSLPDFYNHAVDGLEIGAGVGSCGTAASTGRRVIVEDIASHPYWAAFRDLAARAQLASCWSEPIVSSKGRLLGTFAIYHRQPCAADEAALQLIGHAANLASIAIEHHLADEELERQAHTDFLTELYSRRYFIELADAELARATRYRKALSLFMFDVDHFKEVNDRHGHKAGDMVLQTIAATMRNTLREVDFVGRMGGEEFAAVLPETDEGEAWEAAERLRLAVADAETRTEAGELLRVTISVGVATRADAPTTVDALLKRADEALYAAKNSGRNRVVSHARGDGASGLVRISWNETYECGHALLDEQHRALFRHAHDLLSAILSGCPATQLVEWVNSLIDEIARHFHDEEAVFVEIGFPDAEKHVDTHRHLLQRARELVNRFQAGQLELGELFQYLANELIAQHILSEDREFMPYLLPSESNGERS